MGRIALHVIFAATYALAAIAVGVALAWFGVLPATLAAGAGALGFLAASQIHATIARPRLKPLEAGLFKVEVRTGQIEAAVEDQNARLDAVEALIQEEVVRRNEAVLGEMRALHGLVTKMASSFDARLNEARRGEAPAAAPRSNEALLTTLKAALDDNRVELHLQPIVSLPQRRTAFYEAFSRVRDAAGRVILPAEFMRVAEPSGLVAEIDNLSLFRCAQIARRLARQDRRMAVFCNLAPASLADEQFFPTFLAYLRENRDLASNLVFEIAHQSFLDLPTTAERNLDRVFDMGFRFSIDRVAEVNLDLRALERAGVRYVKIPGAVLKRALIDGDGAGLSRDIQPADVNGLFARYGIDLIADRIEDERTVVELLDLDIRFGQGHLFGQPRPLREGAVENPGPAMRVVRAA